MTRHHPLPPAGTRRHLVGGRDQRGAAMVEFALVVVLFVSVLYALIYFGMALATKQRVTNAAAEGARAAVGQAVANAPTVASNRVKALLGEPNGRYTILTSTATCASLAPPSTTTTTIPPPTAQCITVTVDYDWRNYPVVPAAPGLNVLPVNNLLSTAVVQFAG